MHALARIYHFAQQHKRDFVSARYARLSTISHEKLREQARAIIQPVRSDCGNRMEIHVRTLVHNPS